MNTTELASLNAQIAEDHIFTPDMFEGKDLWEIYHHRVRGSFASGKWGTFEQIDEANPPTPVEAIEKIKVLVKSKVHQLIDPLPSNDDEEKALLCDHIVEDFEMIASALYLSAELPYLNATWLTYKAGAIPSEGLEVSGALPQFIDVGKEEAAKLLEPAKRTYTEALESSKRERDNKHEALENAIANMPGPIPTHSVLVELLGVNGSGFSLEKTRIATHATEIEPEIPIPTVWREWLEAQEKGQPIKWEKLWLPMRKRLPAV